MYKTLLTICLFGLIPACKSRDHLQRVCGNMGPGKCYAVAGLSPWLKGWESEEELEDLRNWYAGRGPCHIGEAVCDDSGNMIACNGDAGPTSEICDSQDNDCDELVDEDRDGNPLASYGPGNACLSYGICKEGRSICVNGGYECTINPQEEVCDNKDNDCDGVVDNIIYDEFCYTGSSILEASKGTCKAGILVCKYGQEECIGEILPQTEVCDGLDNDCDGYLDDTEKTLNRKFDIVFAIDSSQSMCEEINAVAVAIKEYVAQYIDRPNYRWAIASMSYAYGTWMKVVTDFTSIEQVQTIMMNTGCGGVGEEDSLGVMYDLCERPPNLLDFSWDNEAQQLIFGFTDERAQSYTFYPPILQTNVTDTCLENNVLPYMWTASPVDFKSMVEDAGGKHFDLVEDWHQIFDDMNSITQEFCED